MKFDSDFKNVFLISAVAKYRMMYKCDFLGHLKRDLVLPLSDVVGTSQWF